MLMIFSGVSQPRLCHLAETRLACQWRPDPLEISWRSRHLPLNNIRRPFEWFDQLGERVDPPIRRLSISRFVSQIVLSYRSNSLKFYFPRLWDGPLLNMINMRATDVNVSPMITHAIAIILDIPKGVVKVDNPQGNLEFQSIVQSGYSWAFGR